MENDSKKYISLARLSDFLDNLSNKFASLIHKHSVSDLTDYAVDTTLSSTSTNPVQNKVLDAEFDAVSDALGALELAVDGKSDAAHNHDERYYTETETDQKLSEKAELLHIHPYGVCSSSETYTTKTVTVENFSLVEGARVIVKFTNANENSSPKLNVNNTGAIPIMQYGTTTVGSNKETSGWEAGAVLAFTYDGTNWVRDYWYNTTYTNAKLGQGYGTCYTATSTAEKEVSMTGYEDKTGGIVSIKFTYSVDAGATLNINGQGALDIYYNGSAIVDDVIKGGDVATFINSGSSYRLISVDRWHEDIMALQASESKVKQMETIANGNFPILLAPSDINGTDYRYTYYADGIYANPNIRKIYADISGNAGSASALADDSIEKIQLNDGGIKIVTTSGTGSAYTATVEGMTELKTGARITIIPHINSTAKTATLNVNNLGAKQIRMRLSTNTTTTTTSHLDNWLVSGKPVTLMYNGTYWITDYAISDANTIYGNVKVANGGTGATDAKTARENLGITPENIGAVDKTKVVNDLTTTEEGYVADARALKTLNDKFNMDLLWENESYTSDFLAQTVNISNPSKYNMFVIRYKLCADSDYDYWGTSICVKGCRGWISEVMGSGGQSGSYTFSAWRQLIIPNGGNITFFDCYKNNKTTNTPEVDNGWMIPYQIFGIKGGITT